jgi:ribonuclease-3
MPPATHTEALDAALGYRFRDGRLLRQALTHRSHSALHNERLEFLGDGVLDCVIGEELYRRFPSADEGELSRLRASLVNQTRLSEVAMCIGLGAHLLLGEGEAKSGGAERPSMLADALEALLGAVIVDGGYDAARKVVLRVYDAVLATTDPRALDKDSKTLLQEFLQARHLALPRYSVVATEGEAHAQSFRVDCVVQDLAIHTEGTGTSRRSAEQMAALKAYELAVAK